MAALRLVEPVLLEGPVLEWWDLKNIPSYLTGVKTSRNFTLGISI